VSQSGPTDTRDLEPAEVVLRFLEGVGAGSEAEFYLRLFRSRPSEQFATIAVLAHALDDDAGSVTFDLRLLHHLGLTPVVMLGLDGLDNTWMRAEQLGHRLGSAGIDTVLLASSAPREEIATATVHGRIPLVIAEAADGTARQAELAAILTALRTHKLILLRNEGGLRLGGEPLSVVNLSTQFAALCRNGRLSDADQSLLADVRHLVFELVPHRLLVSLASPLNLLHELFTVRGAGTMLRKGARIEHHDGYDGVDVDRLGALLQSGFGRAPRPAFFDAPPRHSYIEDTYRGAALVVDTPLGAYLTKFAVTREAQGEGIGQDLWGALTADHPTLIWRARRDNPIRTWYERQCHGRFDAGDWTVYARGLRADQMGDAVAFATAQPVDF
jgi:acetylglutamate kinase